MFWVRNKKSNFKLHIFILTWKPVSCAKVLVKHDISLYFQAGIAAAPARAMSAVKDMNIPQKIKDMKLPDLPSIGNLKF